MKNKPVSVICCGLQTLISAQLLKGRHATCYKSVANEIKESGAIYEDKRIVVNGNLVISRQPSDLPAFLCKQSNFLNKPNKKGSKFMKLIKFLIIFFMLISFAYAQDMKERKVFKAVVDKDNVQRLEIIGGSYFFNPDYIIVKVNIPVELIVKKEPGITPHDIVINAPGAGIDFKEDLTTEPKIIRFTPLKTGKYPIYCSKRFLFFKSHRERGMEGVLEVVE